MFGGDGWKRQSELVGINYSIVHVGCIIRQGIDEGLGGSERRYAMHPNVYYSTLSFVQAENENLKRLIYSKHYLYAIKI